MSQTMTTYIEKTKTLKTSLSTVSLEGGLLAGTEASSGRRRSGGGALTRVAVILHTGAGRATFEGGQAQTSNLVVDGRLQILHGLAVITLWSPHANTRDTRRSAWVGGCAGARNTSWSQQSTPLTHHTHTYVVVRVRGLVGILALGLALRGIRFVSHTCRGTCCGGSNVNKWGVRQQRPMPRV